LVIDVKTPEPPPVHVTWWEAGLRKLLHIAKTKASQETIMNMLREVICDALPKPNRDTSTESESSAEDDNYVDCEEEDEDEDNKLKADDYESKMGGSEEETFKEFMRALNYATTTARQEQIMIVVVILKESP
jgi:hypothetical protein